MSAASRPAGQCCTDLAVAGPEPHLSGGPHVNHAAGNPHVNHAAGNPHVTQAAGGPHVNTVAGGLPVPGAGPPRAAVLFEPRIRRRRMVAGAFRAMCLVVCLGGLATLFVLLGVIFVQGWPWVSWDFLTRPPSQLNPKGGGMHSAIVGSIWLIVLTGLIAVPVGVGAAVYLHEYAGDSRLNRLIRLNIANLAGVPAIVYGILGLTIFVRWLYLDRSVIAGALTMALLVLPVIVIAAREALEAVPRSMREAAFALGATRWQTVRHHVLPAAAPGIMTGIILSLSRAIGEAAPLMVMIGLVYTRSVPGGSLEDYGRTPAGLWQWFTTALGDGFAAMPVQIFNWTSQPQRDFHDLAAAGIIVLLGVLLTMNAAAVAIRAWQQRSLQ